MIKKYIVIIIVASLTGLTSCTGVLGGYEEAEFKVIEKNNNIEIREYSSYLVAKVNVDGSRDEAVSKGFKVLGGYIFGNNIAKQEIAMTAPVAQEKTQELKSQEIAMTVPVAQTKGDANSWNITFMMPSEYSIEDLPKPKDERVIFEKIDNYKAAAIVFSGSFSDENFGKHEKELLEYLKENKISYLENPTHAYYNPPWTLWFLRRNEVIFKLK